MNINKNFLEREKRNLNFNYRTCSAIGGMFFVIIAFSLDYIGVPEKYIPRVIIVALGTFLFIVLVVGLIKLVKFLIRFKNNLPEEDSTFDYGGNFKKVLIFTISVLVIFTLIVTYASY